MYARAFPEARSVAFFLHDPRENEQLLYDPHRPAFTMSWSSDKTEWRLVQEKCENCQFAPKHLSCSCADKQQVAFVRHHRCHVGDGIFNGMEVHLPGICSDGRPLVWCSKLGRGDLADAEQALDLTAKMPAWSDEVESLVLDFKGRRIQSSAKNFQLVPQCGKDQPLCQYGKVGPNTFSLDFKFPLSVIQAFGISMTTLFWV